MTNSNEFTNINVVDFKIVDVFYAKAVSSDLKVVRSALMKRVHQVQRRSKTFEIMRELAPSLEHAMHWFAPFPPKPFLKEEP